MLKGTDLKSITAWGFDYYSGAKVADMAQKYNVHKNYFAEYTLRWKLPCRPKSFINDRRTDWLADPEIVALREKYKP